MEGNASRYFADRIADYDSLIRRAVPDYDTMLERLATYLPPGDPRILELGCGTGNFSLQLAGRYPGARLELVDGSAEMLELCAARLAESGVQPPARVQRHQALFEELEVAAGAFDLVVSCISLHHVVDKAALFDRVFGWLRPGGHFLYADQMAGGDAATGELNWERWLDFCRSEPACSEAEIQSLLDHASAHDHYEPIYPQLRALEGAGFCDPDCVWRNWMWGIVRARKA